MIILRPRKSFTNKPQLGVGAFTGNPLSAGLVRAWVLNDGGGINPTDLIRQDPLIPFPSSPYYPSWERGIHGSAYGFDGNTHGRIAYGVQSAECDFGTAPFTAAVWTKPTFNSGNTWIFSNGSSTPFWSISLNGGPLFWCNSAADVRAQSATSPTLGLWYFYVGVRRDSTNIELWVNGKLDAQGSGSMGNVTSGKTNLPLGTTGTGGGGYYDGLISSACLWNRALSAAEIQTLYVDPFAFMTPARSRLWAVPAGGGGGFQPAWAVNSNIFLGGGVR